MVELVIILHTIATEVVVGTFVLATLCSIILCFTSWFGGQFNTRIVEIDATLHIGVLLGCISIPVAIMTGISSSPTGDLQGAYLQNKIIFSGPLIAFWSAVLFHRKRIGVELWNNRLQATFQSTLIIIAMSMTAILASIGGKISKGGSLLDWLPIKIDFSKSFLLPEFSVWLLFIFGVISIVIVLATKVNSRNLI